MAQIALDAAKWLQPDDFYSALLPQLGAPSWHGHNLDALYDSIFVGDINRLNPPFRIIVNGTAALHHDMLNFLKIVADLFKSGRKETQREAYIEFAPPLSS